MLFALSIVGASLASAGPLPQQDGPPQLERPGDVPSVEELERNPRVWGTGDFGGFFERGPRPAPPPPSVLQDWLVVRADAGVDGEQWLVRHALNPDAELPRADDGLGERANAPRWLAMTSEAPTDVALAFTTVLRDAPCVRMADLQGAELLIANGECFTGDPERRGFRGVPIALRRGVNRLFVAGVRGSFSLSLAEPPGELVIGTWDVAWPGFGPDDDEHDVSYPIFNASRQPASVLHLHYGTAVNGSARCTPRLAEWADANPAYLPPLALRLGSHYWTDIAGRNVDCSKPGAFSPVCVYAGDPARAPIGASFTRRPAAGEAQGRIRRARTRAFPVRG